MATLREAQAEVEDARVRLLVERDGRQAALEWTARTLEAYRGAVQNPAHFASNKEYRPLFEASIEALDALAKKLKAGGLD